MRFSIIFFQHQGTKTPRHQETLQKTRVGREWMWMNTDGSEGELNLWEIQR
jgi:hypothetical protein